MSRIAAWVTTIAFALSTVTLALGAEPGGPEKLVTAEEAYQIKLHQALAAAIEGGTGSVRASEEDKAALKAFYDKRDGKPFWTDGAKLTPAAQSAIAILTHAGDWALKASDYPVPAASLGADGAPATPEALANAEVRLSLSSLAFAHDAHVGRVEPQQVGNNIDRGSTPPNPTKVLDGFEKAEDAGKYLVSFNPHHPQFELLLRKYRELIGGKAVAETEAVPPEPGAEDLGGAAVRLPAGPRLQPGDRHPQIVLLRKRLGAPLPHGASVADATVYDDVLAEAVRKFQGDHNLPDDGAVDYRLRRALNAAIVTRSSTKTVTQAEGKFNAGGGQLTDRILVNLQRWRWMREDLGEFYVFDNVPEFLTRVIDHSKVIFTEKIVVGKADTMTPTFSQDMQFVEFHPFWGVPNSIKLKEILPNLRAGNDIMGQQNLRAFYKGQPVDVNTVDWATTDIRNFEFQQPPGKENVLGVVKFMFPNHFDVYMHDTPSKQLFNQKERAFSHGCMRVHNPDQLAAVLLGHDQGWTPADVARAIESEGNQQVRLQSHIPVHVAYFTAWVQEDGSLTTFGDVYGHDRRLGLALTGQTQLLAQEVAALNAKATQVAPDPGIEDSAPNFLSFLFGH